MLIFFGIILSFLNFANKSLNKEVRRNFQIIYKISIILTLIGSVILLFGIFGFGYELGEIADLWIVGAIFVLSGLVVIPIVAWLWMFKKEKKR